MNSVILELQEIHKDLIELRDIAETEKVGAEDEFESGYATGSESAFAASANKVAKLLEFASRLHSEA